MIGSNEESWTERVTGAIGELVENIAKGGRTPRPLGPPRPMPELIRYSEVIKRNADGSYKGPFKASYENEGKIR